MLINASTDKNNVFLTFKPTSSLNTFEATNDNRITAYNSPSENGNFVDKTNFSVNVKKNSQNLFESNNNLIDFSIKFPNTEIISNNTSLKSNNAILAQTFNIEESSSSILFDSSKGYITINSEYPSISTQSLNTKLLNQLLTKLKSNNQLVLNNNQLNGQFYADSNLLKLLFNNNNANNNDVITQYNNETLNSSQQQHQQPMTSITNHNTPIPTSSTHILYTCTNTNEICNEIIQANDCPILTNDIVDIALNGEDDVTASESKTINKCDEICCLLKSLDRDNNF